MPAKKCPSIFITDDDADDREFVIEALRKFGFKGEFSEFDDGQKLYDYLSSHPQNLPDLILLDLNMPIKDGFETLQELKANDYMGNIPIIVLTASSRKEDEQRCVKLGCDHFETKPLTIEGYEALAHYVSAHVGI